MKAEVKFECRVNTSKAEKKIARVTQLIKKLNEEINYLEDAKIEISVVEYEKKWWQFWR